MNFKDQLKKENNQAIARENEKKAEAEKLAREPIPEKELNRLAAEMANTIKDLFLNKRTSFNYDYGKIFKNRKTNFRLEVFRHWSFRPITRIGEGGGYYKDFLPDSIYFTQNDHDMIPTDLYATKHHLEQLFRAVKNILDDEGILSDWEINSNLGKANYRAYIKCDSEGKII